MGLTLSEQHYAALLAHAEADLPNEACGILAGIGGRVCRVYPVENIHHSPTVYEMNPAQQIAAFLDLEAAGWELSGIYHSHPAGPPTPSATDVAEAAYPVVNVIIAPAQGDWLARGFWIEAAAVEEIPLVVSK